MIRKLTLVAGFGAGYVLGAKAGVQRYNQIMSKVNELAGRPAVKDATSGLQQTASTLADRARETVNDTVSTVNDKVSGSSSPSSPSSDTIIGTPVAVVDLDPSPMPGAAASVTAPDLGTTPLRPPLRP